MQLQALALGFDDSFTEVVSVEQVLIPHAFIEGQLHGRGLYLLMLYIEQRKVVTLQGGEEASLNKGCYIYTSQTVNDPAGETAPTSRKERGKTAHQLSYCCSR